jgi:hypothetical protein
MRKKVYRKRIRGFPKIAFALFALFPIFCMWGETDEKDNQIIVDFMKNYVNVDVLDIKYEGIEGKEYKDSLSPKPFLLGINYRKYRVKTNLPLIFPELYILMEETKLFTYMEWTPK